MKVESISTVNLSSGVAALEILVNGCSSFAVIEGPAEDNTLDKNFQDCYNIVELMQAAYEAGRNGELLEISEDEQIIH